jgi:NADH:ubiquinone oxidoreductase subunit F (NADH-binding)
VALGTPLAELVALARPTRPVRALLLGGCFGTWVAHEDAAGMPLAHHGLRERAASLGAGVVVVLGQGTCGLCETAAALEYLADESAGQCGPCVFGLRAIADRMAELADGTAPPGSLEQLARWAAMVARRGACHHPDGAVRLLRSALDVYAAEAAAHQAGGACPSMLRGAALGLPVHHRRGA